MKLQKTFIITSIIFILIIHTALAQTFEGFAKIVGVDNQGKGIVGNVSVEIQPGKGRILVNTQPLQGIYTQDSERIAVKVTGEVTGFDFSNYDVIYTITTSGANVVEGPSAGGAMTLATIVAVEGKTLSDSFSMTGTIQEDHSIGRVGEVLAKTKAAADSGVTVFLIPKGQAQQIEYVKKTETPAPGWYIETIEPVEVNIIDLAKDWGMQVYEVATIEEATQYAFGEIPSPKQPSTKPIQISISLPSFSSPVGSYREFSDLAFDEIERAERLYGKAEDKLDPALLPDDVVTGLDLLLTRAKELLDVADSIRNSGYTYSAGNNAFRSAIYSKTVIDLVDYYKTSSAVRPSLLEKRLNETTAEIAGVKEEIKTKTANAVCNANVFEWAVAAQQRITYAENKIAEVDVSSPGNAYFDINLAEEWVEISQAFLSKISPSTSECQPQFESSAIALVATAENRVKAAQAVNVEVARDAQWFLNAAKKELSEGWYVTAMYDATSAKVRAEIGARYQGKNVTEIYDAFNEEQFTTSGLIGTIFFENAQYTMYTAIKDNSENDALEALELLHASKEVNDVYLQTKTQLGGGLPLLPVFQPRFDIRELVKEYGEAILIVLVGVLVVYAFQLRREVRELKEELTKIKTMRGKPVKKKLKRK